MADKRASIKKIPESKIRAVKEMSELIKKKRTILVASIKGIPASQFNEIAKKLRGKAIVKVPKKNLIFRAIDSSENEELKKLKEKIVDSIAVLFSDIDSFELASELLEKKNPAKAKAGQEAPEDIEIPEGPTDLVPGPAISELGALGIQIQIDKGKIRIKQPKVIVKKGDKISQAAADVMSKLDIKPFSIGFIPLSAFDTKENKIYLEIKIDREKTLNELKYAFGKSLSFAVGIGYTSKDTIRFLLSKAISHERRLKKIITGENEEVIGQNTEEIKQETPAEEKKESSAEGLASLFG